MLSDRAGTFPTRSGQVGRGSGAAQLPDAGKRQPRVDTESAENLFVAGEHVAESGELTGRGIRKRHATGAAAGAGTKGSRLEHQDGPVGSEPAQPGRGGKAREASANNGEIHMIGESARGGAEIHGPGRRAPGMRFARASITLRFAKRGISTRFARHDVSLMRWDCGACREFPRLSQTLLAAGQILFVGRLLISSSAAKRGKGGRRRR